MEIIFILKDKYGIKYYTDDAEIAVTWKNKGRTCMERQIYPISKISFEDLYNENTRP